MPNLCRRNSFSFTRPRDCPVHSLSTCPRYSSLRELRSGRKRHRRLSCILGIFNKPPEREERCCGHSAAFAGAPFLCKAGRKTTFACLVYLRCLNDPGNDVLLG